METFSKIPKGVLFTISYISLERYRKTLHFPWKTNYEKFKNEEEKWRWKKLTWWVKWDIHFWYRESLNFADFKYIIIFLKHYLLQKIWPLKDGQLKPKSRVFCCFSTPTRHFWRAVSFEAVQARKKGAKDLRIRRVLK